MSDKIWLKYMHVERLDSEEVEGILEMDKIFVMPKIDGANASVCLDEKGRLRVGKRSAVIAVDDDFRGLYEYVNQYKDNYKKFFEAYPKHIIYAEWLIKHTISYYRDSAWNKLYAYDIMNLETGDFLPIDKCVEIFTEFDILQIPPIAVLKGPLISKQGREQLEEYANNNKFLIDDKEKVGEGIVIKGFRENGEPYRNKFGRVTWSKLVRQEFKEIHTIEMGITKRNLKEECEKLFVDTFVTPARFEKIKQKIMTDRDTGWRTEYIGEMLGRMWNDIFVEELWTFVKKNKIREFNFSLANRYCIIKTKQIMGV